MDFHYIKKPNYQTDNVVHVQHHAYGKHIYLVAFGFETKEILKHITNQCPSSVIIYNATTSYTDEIPLHMAKQLNITKDRAARIYAEMLNNKEMSYKTLNLKMQES